MGLLAGRMLAVYAVLVVGITMVVDPAPLLREAAVGIVAVMDWPSGDATRDTVIAALEVFANVALFVPVGLLVALRWRGLYWWEVVALGLAVSMTVEATQLAVLDSREATVRDLSSNTVGAALGVALAATLVAVRRHRIARN